MGTWSITPSTASIDQNGNVTFPKNTESTEKTYTIKYTDGDMVCEKKVIQEGTGCIFSYDANSTNIPGDRESEYTFGTITPNGADVSQITIEVYEGAEYINGSLSINSSNQVVGTVKKNETQSTRTIKYKLKTANGSVCYDKTATQGKGCDCDSDTDFRISPMSFSWAWNETTPKTASITAEACITNIRIDSTLSDFTASLNSAKTVLTVAPKNKNLDETPNSENLVIKASDSGKECTKTISLVQAANTCNCTSIVYTPDTSMIPSDATSATLGTFTMKDGCEFSLVDIYVSASDDPYGITNGSISIGETSPHDVVVGIVPHPQTISDLSFTYHVRYNGKEDNCYNGTKTQKAGTVCTCNQVEKVYNEENEPSYFYALVEDLTTTPPQPLTNVPFAILTADTSFGCDSSVIRPEAVDGGITSISCAEYTESFWTGGWRTSFFQKFRNYCATLSRTSKVFIIYGTLSSVESGKEKRPSGFRYYVSNSVCEDGTIFRVFQRCACGMDNCKNDYTIEEAREHHILTEDRPLYLDSCSSEWSDGDSICVEKLSVTGARLFKVVNGVKQKLIDNTFTPDGTKYILRDKDINWDYTNVICWTSTTQQYCDMTAYCQGKQLNPQYIQWPTSKPSYLNISRMLTLIDDSTYNAVLRIMLSPNGIDSGRGMVQYDIEVERHNYEQLIEIDYHTGDNLKMTAGPTVGWCALKDFTVSIYIAPSGYGYTKEDISGENYKRKLVKCCRCNETVVSSVVPRTNIPAAGSNEYIPICTVNLNEGCRAHDMIALAKSSGSDIIKVENNELKFDYNFSIKDKQIIVTALVNPNTSGSLVEENLVLEIYFNESTPCVRQNITIKQLG